MASPWSYAYDNANCPSGIFYVNDPRENAVHKKNQVSHQGPYLNNLRHNTLGGATTAFCGMMQYDPNERNFSPPLQPQPDRIYLPALRVSAKVSIKAMVAETIITQSFQNFKDTPIERASYSFPLYHDSVVHSFKCVIGKHQVIEGVVEPKEKAKAEFEKAVSRQRVAAMLEEHTPEIFETHIGSIPANEVIRVEMSYISELKVDLLSKDVVFVLPTSIAPRYGTPPDNYSESNSTIEEQGLEISVDVSLPVPITSLASRSHPISVTIGSTAPTSFKDMNTEMDLRKGNATLSNRSAKLENDFILLISPKESISDTRAFMEPHPEYNNHSAIMVTISPQDFAKNSSSTDCSNFEILFVIDCSGSMADKVNDLRTAMKVAIRSLPEGCFFNMCFFGSSHELLWESSKPATQKNSDEAFLRSARLAADKGGTELNSALKHVVTSRIPNMETNIIVVTDGECWDTEEIHASVREANKEQGIRFFCLGIGNRVSHALVEGIGRQGCGLSEVVAVAEPGKWEARVIRLLKGALTPTSWHIRLHPGPSLENAGNRYSILGQDTSLLPDFRAPSSIQAPFQTPKLHTFSRLSSFLLVNNSAFEHSGSKIHIIAESSSGGIVELVISPEKVESTPSAIHFLAAHAVVKDLENGTSWLHDMKYDTYRQGNDIKFQDLVKKEAEAVAKTWSVVGKWTSFIAVETSRQNSNIKNLVHLYRPEALPLSGSPITSNSVVRKSRQTSSSPPMIHHAIGPQSYMPEPNLSLRPRDSSPPSEYYPSVVSTFSTSSKDLEKYPQHLLGIRAYEPIVDSMQRSPPHLSDQESTEDLQTSGMSFAEIISTQLSTGCFIFHPKSLNALLGAFDENSIQHMKSKLAAQSCGAEEPLLPTILAVVYLVMQFQEKLNLLELVLDKATKWLGKNIQGEQDEIWEIARGGYVGNSV